MTTDGIERGIVKAALHLYIKKTKIITTEEICNFTTDNTLKLFKILLTLIHSSIQMNTEQDFGKLHGALI